MFISLAISNTNYTPYSQWQTHNTIIDQQCNWHQDSAWIQDQNLKCSQQTIIKIWSEQIGQVMI